VSVAWRPDARAARADYAAGVHYDWQAALVFVAALVALSLLTKWLVFRVPAFRRMRALNQEADAAKLARPRFQAAVTASNRAGLAVNAAFYALVLPWCISLAPRPWWRHALDVVAVLMLYDFAYYWTHRSLFHGKLLRKVHALHHQAHTPTNIDGYYVHPLETAIGILLFLGSMPLVAALSGGPLHAGGMAVATLLFTQLNILNHVFVNLPQQPYRTASTISWLHAAHHVNMNRGNYATLILLYDWLFGTLEKPVRREAA
jgi:sterol desaturase/sphingolipid hydroxylase (fatty acid hydroxylase superfamily)